MGKAETGVINIHGREYQTVAYRVQRFREAHPLWTLATKIVSRDADCVVVEATISDEQGRLIANGHAEEYRKASQINKTAALENAETSAIGRALAALGLGGTEFATADELATKLAGKPLSGPHKPTDGALEAFTAQHGEEAVQYLRETAATLVDAVEAQNDVAAAVDMLAEAKLDNDEKLALWAILAPNSKTRNAIKKETERRRQEAALGSEIQP